MANRLKVKKLGMWEIMKLSFAIYKSKFLSIVAVVVIFYMPFTVMMEFIPENIKQAFYDLRFVQNVDSVFYYYYFVILISIVLAAFEYAALAYIAKYAAEGRKIKAEGIAEATVLRWWRLIATALIYIFCISFFTVLIIPALYFSVCFVYSINITALSSKWGFSAMLESRGIIKGAFWRIAGFMTLFLIAYILINFAVGFAVYVLGITEAGTWNIMVGLLKGVLFAYFYLTMAVQFLNLATVKKAEIENRQNDWRV